MIMTNSKRILLACLAGLAYFLYWRLPPLWDLVAIGAALVLIYLFKGNEKKSDSIGKDSGFSDYSFLTNWKLPESSSERIGFGVGYFVFACAIFMYDVIIGKVRAPEMPILLAYESYRKQFDTVVIVGCVCVAGFYLASALWLRRSSRK